MQVNAVTAYVCRQAKISFTWCAWSQIGAPQFFLGVLTEVPRQCNGANAHVAYLTQDLVHFLMPKIGYESNLQMTACQKKWSR